VLAAQEEPLLVLVLGPVAPLRGPAEATQAGRHAALELGEVNRLDVDGDLVEVADPVAGHHLGEPVGLEPPRRGQSARQLNAGGGHIRHLLS
jgi:hypothetical protein